MAKDSRRVLIATQSKPDSRALLAQNPVGPGTRPTTCSTRRAKASRSLSRLVAALSSRPIGSPSEFNLIGRLMPDRPAALDGCVFRDRKRSVTSLPATWNFH
jgi:hypothetical protein